MHHRRCLMTIVCVLSLVTAGLAILIPENSQAAHVGSFILKSVKDPIQVSTPCGFELQALDWTGSPDSRYTGTVIFSSSDPASSVPPIYTFTESDAGKRAFPYGAVIFRTAGEQSLTVADVSDPAMTGRQSNITVIPDDPSNHPPQVSVLGGERLVLWKASYTFTINASDPDGDLLVYTWSWGDGTTTVTSTQSATHAYVARGAFLLTVYADDGTYLNGHNVSSEVTVHCDAFIQQPEIISYEVGRTCALVGESVDFRAVVKIPGGLHTTCTFQFGDGFTAAIQIPTLAPYSLVNVTASHLYLASGSFSSRLVAAELSNPTEPGTSSSIIVVTTSTSKGLLRVSTTPAVPAMISLDGNWLSRWGVDWLEVVAGPHVLSFGEVPGYQTPPPQSVTVPSNGVAEVVGSYALLATLRVITAPAVPSTIYVNGLPRNDWGLWTNVPAGVYNISYGPVADFRAPPTQQVTLATGAQTEVVGTFNPSPGSRGPYPLDYGLLRVVTSPAVPSMICLDGRWMSQWGLDWVKIPLGRHNLTFSDVPGLLTPGPIEVDVLPATLGPNSCEAHFATAAVLMISTSPPVPSTIYVDHFERSVWGLWIDVAPGTYLVEFGAVPGMLQPSSQSVTVAAAEVREISGVFVPQ